MFFVGLQRNAKQAKLSRIEMRKEPTPIPEEAQRPTPPPAPPVEEPNAIRDPLLKEAALFQSAVSGLWYTNPNAAGDVSAIRWRGKLYVEVD